MLNGVLEYPAERIKYLFGNNKVQTVTKRVACNGDKGVTIPYQRCNFIRMTSKPLYKNVHQDLIDACKIKDRDAQMQVYRLYYRAMHNTAYRIVNDAHTAEDIMQEAFLKAFSKIDSYNNTSSFGAWLKRIVINESINELRRRKPEYSMDVIETGQAEHEKEDGEWKNLTVRKIRAGIEKLNDRYRAVLNLILVEGYDHREVAEILDVSYNNTRVLYTRARQKLREILKEE